MPEIGGLPVHPLVVHAVVVLLPLSSLLAVLFAVPRTRAWSRWPLLLVTAAAATAMLVARASGSDLQAALGAGGPVARQIAEHQARADLLVPIVGVHLVLAAGAFALSGRAGTAARFVGLVAALVVASGIAVAVQVVRVGDAGTRAVWNPTGQASYSSPASLLDSRRR